MENEGWFDPWSLLSAFRKKARSLGVEFINANVVGFDIPDRKYINAVKVLCTLLELGEGFTDEILFALFGLQYVPQGSSVVDSLRPGIVVNAAGLYLYFELHYDLLFEKKMCCFISLSFAHSFLLLLLLFLH